MAGYKSQLFRYGLSALRTLGVARALRPFLAGKGAILMLHRIQPASAPRSFAPNATLAITPQYLDALLASFRRAAIDVLSLDEVLQRLLSPAPTRRFVSFTFDDGYRDNLELALPIFRKHAAPFTVYATSSFVDRSFAPWWYVLETIVAANARVCWRSGHDETWYDTSDLTAKQRAYAQLSGVCFSLPQRALQTELQRFASDHGLSISEFAARETCGLAELQALRAGGAEIGCHTVSHALLLHASEADVRHELSASRTALEAGLGVPVNHLAYPYGKPDHVGVRELAIAKQLGFATATTTRKGALFAVHAHHRHALPRVEVTSSFADSTEHLHTILSGLPLVLWNHGRRAIVD